MNYSLTAFRFPVAKVMNEFFPVTVILTVQNAVKRMLPMLPVWKSGFLFRSFTAKVQLLVIMKWEHNKDI
jgi:hypothetical protein